MKKLFYILLMCSLSSNAQELEWVKCFDSNYSAITDISIDVDNYIFVLGMYSEHLNIDTYNFNTLSNSDLQLFISKFDSDGNSIWAFSSGTTGELGNIIPVNVSVDIDNNVYFTGKIAKNCFFDTILLNAEYNDPQIFLGKLNDEGHIIWAKTLGSSVGMDNCTNVTVSQNQQIFLSGYFANTTTFDSSTFYSTGSIDFYYSEFNSNGNLLNFHNDGYSSCYLAGIEFIDNSIYAKVNYLNSITANTNFIQCNSQSCSVLIKYSIQGNFDWIKEVVDNVDNDEQLYNVNHMKIKNNRVYLSGTFSDSIKFDNNTLLGTKNYNLYISEYDTTGNFLKTKEIGSSGSVIGCNHDIDSKGNVYVTGDFRDTAYFGDTMLVSCGAQDVFIAKYDTSLNLSWVVQLCDISNCSSTDILLDNQNYVYVVGQAGYQTYILGTVLDSNEDAFILKLSHEDTLSNNNVVMQKPKASLLEVFPNPASKFLIVKLRENVSSAKIALYSITGNILLNETINSKQFTIDVSTLKSGSYLLKVLTDNSVYNEKINIMR